MNTHSRLVHIYRQSALDNCPTTRLPALFPVYKIRIIFLLPSTKLFFASKTSDIVWIVIAWVVKETCFSERFWTRFEF